MTDSTLTSAIEHIKSHNLQGLAAADWDTDGWNVAYEDGSTMKFTKQQFLDAQFMVGHVKTLIIESPHMKERNDYSVAQVYYDAELNQFDPPCTVKLFPGKLAPKVAKYANNLEDGMPIKTRDAESILLYAMDHPSTVAVLKKFIRPQEDMRRSTWIHREAVRKDAKLFLNKLRATWSAMRPKEQNDMPVVQQALALVSMRLSDIPEDVLVQFKLKIAKAGPQKGKLVCEGKPTQLMTAYACIVGTDGKLRKRPDGKFVGISYLMNEVVGLCHSHQPNMLRSNFVHWGMRLSAKKGIDRNTFTKNVGAMLRVMRDSQQELEAG